jgi:hypothetical protein
MKKQFSISSVGRIIVFFEVIMCAVWTLSVFMVNGTDTISQDHVALFCMVAMTVSSIILLKARKPLFNKVVLGIAVLPLLFISYQATSTFFVPYEAQSMQMPSTQMLFVLNPVR